jgi:hypothetical protein
MATVRPAVGIEPTASQQSFVEQAAFQQTGKAEDSTQSVRFGGRPARIGDQTEQTSALDVRLTLTTRRANELLGRHLSTIRTAQRRVMITTAIQAGRVTAVTVSYPQATKQVVDDQPAPPPATPQPAASQQSDLAALPVPQPVQGKTYLCHREPGDDGALIITDESESSPPADEYEIVSQQMEMVGRPNPLAKFLSGRTIAIGEKLTLPKEVAAQIFNLSDKFGEVTQFTLALQKVEGDGTGRRAVFLASVEAASTDASQMRLQIEGPLLVEVDTCRATSIGLIGPIGMAETRGTYSTSYQVIGTGRLQLKIASEYRDAQH